MKRGVLKITACCLAGTMTFAGSGILSMAAGFDIPLAGLEAKVQEQVAKKEAAGGTVQVPATGYETIAIAQVDEYVNIRDAASEEGAVIGKLYNNAGADILGQEGDWYLIKSGDVTGYVKAEFFATGNKAQKLAKEVGTEVATVNTTTLMVRSKANEKADVLTMVGDSENLQVIADEGDWVKVAVDDDVQGYVSKDYVECKTEFVEAESIEKSELRADAVEDAAQRAKDMLNAAVEAMNSASADEAAYAAFEASAAAAEAKMLASEQQLDYDIQEVAQAAVAAADEAAYASAMAEQAQAAAEAEAQAKAQAQAEADLAAQKQAEADAAAKAAQQAQEQANQQWSEQAQAEADAAAQAAQQAQAQADAEAAAQAQAQADAQQQQQQQQQSTQDNSQDNSSSDSATTVDTSGTSSTRQSIVNFALQFVGNAYVYGGTSLTNGADCSGFTQSVMANFGIGIPRTAGAQSVSGRAVDLGSIQPGDLLFYSGSGDYGIGHVTMYIGNGQVVHASNSTSGIIVSDIGYRTPTCARSYID